jgi:hypothetical protein
MERQRGEVLQSSSEILINVGSSFHCELLIIILLDCLSVFQDLYIYFGPVIGLIVS